MRPSADPPDRTESVSRAAQTLPAARGAHRWSADRSAPGTLSTSAAPAETNALAIVTPTPARNATSRPIPPPPRARRVVDAAAPGRGRRDPARRRAAAAHPRVRAPPLAPDRIDHPAGCNRVEPRRERSARIVGLARAMNGKKGFLHDIVRPHHRG